MRIVGATLMVVVLGLVFALGSGAEAPSPAPAGPPPAVPLVIPAEARARPNPVPASVESIEQGRLLFASQCAMCHGHDGAGTGDLATRLGVVMPDFTDPKAFAKRTDGELFYILSHGHGQMPAEGRLSEAQRWDLINACRALSKKPNR
jgi:mono/diheme cytochrome c family protein